MSTRMEKRSLPDQPRFHYFAVSVGAVLALITFAAVVHIANLSSVAKLVCVLFATLAAALLLHHTMKEKEDVTKHHRWLIKSMQKAILVGFAADTIVSCVQVFSDSKAAVLEEVRTTIDEAEQQVLEIRNAMELHAVCVRPGTENDYEVLTSAQQKNTLLEWRTKLLQVEKPLKSFAPDNDLLIARTTYTLGVISYLLDRNPAQTAKLLGTVSEDGLYGAKTMLLRAHCFMREKSNKDAIELLNKLSTRHPFDKSVAMLLVMVMFRENEFKACIENADRFGEGWSQLEPGAISTRSDGMVLSMHAIALKNIGRTNEAQLLSPDFESAVRTGLAKLNKTRETETWLEYLSGLIQTQQFVSGKCRFDQVQQLADASIQFANNKAFANVMDVLSDYCLEMAEHFDSDGNEFKDLIRLAQSVEAACQDDAQDVQQLRFSRILFWNGVAMRLANRKLNSLGDASENTIYVDAENTIARLFSRIEGATWPRHVQTCRGYVFVRAILLGLKNNNVHVVEMAANDLKKFLASEPFASGDPVIGLLERTLLRAEEILSDEKFASKAPS